MTIGIYALYWEEQDLIYIGQSLDIQRRFKEHFRKLTNNTHSNYKVQKTYNLYGEPDYLILETCTPERCNDLEHIWTDEFNSLDTTVGLNIIEAGNVGYGSKSNNSKYTRFQILKVFSLLYSTLLPHKTIAIRAAVHISLVQGISAGNVHVSLKYEYREQYAKMMENKIPRTMANQTRIRHKNSEYPTLYSPNNEPFTVSSIILFCKEHFPTNVGQATKSLGKVLRGNQKQFNGWYIAKPVLAV